jgi:aryl-alcohol dehydrogenase-like predicted oxidoreductase
MEGRRKDAVIATKFGYRDGKKTSYNAEDVEESLSNSLKNLQTDYIDLYQVSSQLDLGSVSKIT